MDKGIGSGGDDDDHIKQGKRAGWEVFEKRLEIIILFDNPRQFF